MVDSPTNPDNPSEISYTSCPKPHSIQYHQAENFYLQAFTSDLVLSVSLRC